MPNRLIGETCCINPIIKDRLIRGIDESCRANGVLEHDDPLCTTFRSQLAEVGSCEALRTETPPVRQPKPQKMTDYQKHMSVCITTEGMDFYQCVNKWKDPAARMDKEYTGPGYTSPKTQEIMREKVKGFD